ncbi:MAG: PQQ-binding-like beta-propeller repeat protein [Clostridia bacterium]|nr:PQQ-binding-like beta-propeller repeat protein [Clostridia bacterium]
MSVGATDSTKPAKLNLTTTAYENGKKVSNYERDEDETVQMLSPDSYSYWKGGVLTFRGGPFRQNSAFGTVDVQDEKMEVAWSVPVGSLDSYYGIGWGSQPAIVKWPKEVREMMNLVPEKLSVAALKEVIVAGQDGKVYFLDLADGEATRDPISVGFPLNSSVSIDPRGYPLMTVGQSVKKLKSGSGDIGTYLFNLIDQSQMTLLNGTDKTTKNSTNGAFDGSSLIDRSSDTMIVAGENGALYTMRLNSAFSLDTMSLTIDPETASYVSKAKKEKNNQVGVEGSVAMYGEYAYYADTYGILQCVNVNTLQPVWAVDVGDNTDATIALDFDEEGKLGLYTANTVLRQGKKGVCTIRRLDALTGEEVWSYEVKCDYNKNELGGAMASPVIGQNSISNLVIFTLAKTEEGGMVVALDKATGSVTWQQNMSNFSYSSPVAVYNENGDAWIIQGDSEGKMHLLDGQSGAVLSSLQLEGSITGSPAVYNDTLVVGTSGKEASNIYGIKIH